MTLFALPPSRGIGRPAPPRPSSPPLVPPGLLVPALVTTARQASRVALHRTRRFTLLGHVPVLGVLVVPWLWPLHLLIVGLTADHIRLTSDASLSYCDGIRPLRHRPTIVIAVGAGLLWPAVLSAVLVLLLDHGQRTAAASVSAVTLLPVLVELVGLAEFAALNPEWLTLKRERRRRTDQRTTYVLTSLVSRQDGHGFAGRLMDLTYPQWQAADAVVIGYPASKELISYYVRMGARRERPWCVADRPARRRIAFDCRQPLRTRDRAGDEVSTGQINAARRGP